MNIYIVGAGPGESCYLTEYARKKVADADLVIGTKRLFDKLCHLNKNTLCKDISELANCVADNKNLNNICVLASGDVGFYSVAKSLGEKLANTEHLNIEFVNGISSLQYLTAKLGMSYDDMKCVSLHGRDVSAVPYVCYNRKVFALTGGKHKAQDMLAQLVGAGLGGVWAAVGENLSDHGESILIGTAERLAQESFDNLAAVIIRNDNFVNHHEGIDDSAFIRGKTPMTKHAPRLLSLAALAIAPGDLVADIGAGTGAVTVEAARCAYEGLVFAVERDTESVSLIKQNIQKFGAFNAQVIEGFAPEALEELPAVSKAFIGGSGGRLAHILDALLAKNQRLRVVVNAVTLETLHEADAALRARGFNVNISCVNMSNATQIGGYRLMKAENPIHIISGERP